VFCNQRRNKFFLPENASFPWQEKLVPHLIGDFLCEDRVTKRKEEAKLQATVEVIRLHKDKKLFLQQIGQSLNMNYAMQNEFKEGEMKNGGNYFCFRLLSYLKLPVVWLNFLKKINLGSGGRGENFVEGWYFGCCYDDSCVGGGLIKRQ